MGELVIHKDLSTFSSGDGFICCKIDESSKRYKLSIHKVNLLIAIGVFDPALNLLGEALIISGTVIVENSHSDEHCADKVYSQVSILLQGDVWLVTDCSRSHC